MSTIAIHGGAGAIVRAELRVNRTRVLPYAVAALFAGNALLWWGWGPAASRGVSVNNEGFIAGMFAVFSFMTAPFFTALVMADPVLRDFELSVDPLIFSKPITRARYILGKFFGNWFIVLACQFTFVMTMMVLQLVAKNGVQADAPVAWPYIKHFIVIVAISHLALSAVFFAVGTLMRSARAAYVAAAAGYFAYFAWQMMLHRVPASWRVALDPLLMNSFSASSTRGAAGHPAIHYTTAEIANRGAMIAIAVACLVLVQLLFSRRALQPAGGSRSARFTLDLPDAASARKTARAAAPPVSIATIRYSYPDQVATLVSAQVRIAMHERVIALLVLPAVFLCTLSLTLFRVAPGADIAGEYAQRTVDALMPVILCITIFFTGTITHRDSELHIAPMVQSSPASTSAFVVSRVLAVMLLTAVVAFAATLTAFGLQMLREGRADLMPYLNAGAIILLPATVFVVAAAVLAAAVIREKLVFYALAIALSGTMLYFYNTGHTAWWYNPLHYRAWSYDMLADGAERSRLSMHAAWWLTISGVCMAATLRHQARQRDRASVGV